MFATKRREGNGGKTKLEPRDTALEIARLAGEKHAEKIEIIDIRELSSIADFIVICSASSERQVKAVTEHVEKGLKDRGENPIGAEGVDGGRWALLDYFDVIAHVFHAPVRDFYDIDGLWADAPRLALLEADAKGPGGEGSYKGGEEAR